MHAQAMELPCLYLKPGELYLGEPPAVVTTVLGSCVAVILYHRRTRLGTICHALLPSGTCDEGGSLRYLNCAIYAMLNHFLACGINIHEVEAKLFGGGDVLTSVTGNGTVGQQNLATALKLVETEELKLTACDLGGDRGRKVIFRTDTGVVLLKRLKSQDGVQ